MGFDQDDDELAPWEKYVEVRAGIIPPALAKACQDQFDYALGLRNGQTVFFMKAEMIPPGNWVHLSVHVPTDQDDPPIDGVFAHLERGLDVRVADIVWVADAPHGS